MESKLPKKYCGNDGHKFTGFSFQYPENRCHETGKFIFSKRIFCSPACVRCYVRANHNLSPLIITMLELYLRNDLHIEDENTAADPQIIKGHNDTGEGLTIEEYRDTKNSKMWVENLNHLNLQKGIFIAKPQKNHKDSFYKLVLKDYLEENSLYAKMETTNVVE